MMPVLDLIQVRIPDGREASNGKYAPICNQRHQRSPVRTGTIHFNVHVEAAWALTIFCFGQLDRQYFRRRIHISSSPRRSRTSDRCRCPPRPHGPTAPFLIPNYGKA